MINAIITSDIENNKKNLFIWITIVLLYCLIFLPSQGLITTLIVNLVLSYSVVFTVLTTNLDSGWYSFLLTTKAEKKTIVKSLLIMSAGTELVTILITLGIYSVMRIFIPALLTERIFQPIVLMVICIGFSFILFITEIIIALSVKYSVNTARMSLFIIVIIIVLIGLGIIYFLPLNNVSLNVNSMQSLFYISLILIWILIFLAYKVLIKIFEKKEF